MIKLLALLVLLAGCGSSEPASTWVAAPTVVDMAQPDTRPAQPPQLVLACPRTIPIGVETIVQFVGLGDGIALDKLQRSQFYFGLACDPDILSVSYASRGPNAFTLSINVQQGVAPAICDLTITPQGLTLRQALTLVNP